MASLLRSLVGFACCASLLLGCNRRSPELNAKPATGEAAYVGIVALVDGKLFADGTGLIFHSDDRLAYVGVQAFNGRLRNLELPPHTRFGIVVPNDVDAELVDGDVFTWKNEGLLILSAPKEKLSAPLPLVDSPDCRAEQPVRHVALITTREQDHVSFSRRVDKGRIVKVNREDTIGNGPPRIYARFDIPGEIGKKMATGIVSAEDGTPLGFDVEAHATDDESQTVYWCAFPRSLFRYYRGPSLETSTDPVALLSEKLLIPKIKSEGRQVTVNLDLKTFDPFHRIKELFAEIRVEPYEKWKPPAGAKQTHRVVLRSVGREKQRRFYSRLGAPTEVEATTWTGTLKFDNFREPRSEWDYSGSVTGTLKYADLDGSIHTIDHIHMATY